MLEKRKMIGAAGGMSSFRFIPQLLCKVTVYGTHKHLERWTMSGLNSDNGANINSDDCDNKVHNQT